MADPSPSNVNRNDEPSDDEQPQTLASRFIKNKEQKAEYRRQYPSCRNIHSYIITIDRLNDQVKCALGTKCQCITATSEDRQQDEMRKMILCITCDSIYHLCCTSTDVRQLKEEQLPWMCFKCLSNPHNTAALKLSMSNRDTLAFDDRIRQMLKPAVEITSDSSDDDTTYKETVNKSADGPSIPSDILSMLLELRKENKELRKQMQLQERRFEESIRPKQELAAESSTPKLPNNESYTNAILKVNKKAAQIDDQIVRERNLNASLCENVEVVSSEELYKVPSHCHLPSSKQLLGNRETTNLLSDTRRNSMDCELPYKVPSQSTAVSDLNNLAQQHAVTEIRRNLPKIETFDGKPEKWLTFQRSVERNWREGKYPDDLMKLKIRQALIGQPLARVDSLMDFMTASKIMDFLKESYGNSNVIVETAKQKLLNVKMSRPLTHASCIEVTTYIANYIAACNYAGLLVADSTISAKIHNQLEAYHQQNYYEYYFREYPGATTRVERLDVQFKFLNFISKTLPAGNIKSEENKGYKSKAGYQVMTASVSNNQSSNYQPSRTFQSSDSYKYEIRDIQEAKYSGYNLDKVQELPRKCEICGRTGHFSVECNTYRGMKMDAKYHAVRTNNLCLNCLLTSSHNASQCEVKTGCGYKLDRNARCSAKHHITLHRGYGSATSNSSSTNSTYRKQRSRAQGNNNARRVNERIRQFHQSQRSNDSSSATQGPHQAQTISQQNEAQPSTSQNRTHGSVSSIAQERSYELTPMTNAICAVAQSSQRTVKMFRTYFYGNKFKALGYAIGDSASEITLVKRELINDLGIAGEPCTLDIQWTDSSIKSSSALKVKIQISGVPPNNNIIELDECYAVDDFNLPARTLDMQELKQRFNYLKDVPFEGYKNAIPSILIGSRHAHVIEASEPLIGGGNDMPIALKTKLGYTVYGGATENFGKGKCALGAVSLNKANSINETSLANKQLEDLYKHSCSIDNLGIKPIDVYYTRNEKKALELVEEEMKILPNGSVELPLVWNRTGKSIPKLPDNFPMVYKRQLAHEQKLSKTPELIKAFNDNFKELIIEGYVRKATARDLNTPWPNVWYLPMSLVVNQNKEPVKTRNVYDASAKYKGTSLNDNLLMGPNLLVDMLAPLMRMRLYKYAFTGDVKSMFHRVMICERDQQCQRILWREKQQDPMQIYIQQVMLFGPKSSPFGSQIVKNKTADKWTYKYPSAVQALRDYTYMDDLLTSEPTVEKAVETATNCIKILKSINWDLVGFQSNSLKVLQGLSSANVKLETIDIMSAEEATYTTKVLGVAWNPKLDAFTFNLNKNAFIKLVQECGHRPTKRDQCSTIARIFDAMGFISHCLIRGRILLQRSWKEKLDWDDEISAEAHVQWRQWLNDLQKVSLIQIPRLRFQKFNISEASSLELHTFVDAGKEAIAAVTYMIATINGYRYASFVMSKAKVAPLKLKSNRQITEMPRLELLSALIGARLSNTIRNLHKEFDMQVYLWSDSEIVLNWIKNDNLMPPKCAVSAVEEILETTDVQSWNFVDTQNNVADIATKFQKFNFEDINSAWYQGPEFLKCPKDLWPKQKPRINSRFVGNINKAAFCVDSRTVLPPQDCPLANDLIIDLFSASIRSRWNKLVRAVARALKFYFKAIIPMSSSWNDMELRQLIKEQNDFTKIDAYDIERAILFIIRRMQKETYSAEYNKLLNNKRIFTRSLLELNVFIDSNGIMRINSRVNEKSYGSKFVPLVPRKSEFSNTLLFDYHYRHNHVGLETQIADFRSKYWMPQLRQAFRFIQSQCNYCGYIRANPIEYKMSDLPNCRTDASLKPFQVTGLDCAGPFNIFAKNGHAKKVWILIFTCTMSRFIHLHLLDELTSAAVFEAIEIFWPAYGPVSQFISDNGTNFVGAGRIINRETKLLNDFLKSSQRELSNTPNLLQEKLATWTFIPVQSPWFGAFYERLIKTVKKSIASAIEGKKLSRMEFNIAIQQASHRINNRPLTHNPISSEDEEVLTPHLIVKLKSGWPLLPSVQGNKQIPDPLNDRMVYRRGKILADEMTKRFVMEYLPVLTKRTKWFHDFDPIKVNDLVLMIDPNATRQAWGRAKVLKVYKAKDSNVRVVDLQLPDGSIRKNRSTKRLAKLDIKKM
jgi:hypothetical protein